MQKRGRKSKAEKFKVLERYAELSESYFTVIKEALESSRLCDKHWAADHLKNAFVKMIPQQIDGGLGDMPFTLVIKPRDGA